MAPVLIAGLTLPSVGSAYAANPGQTYPRLAKTSTVAGYNCTCVRVVAIWSEGTLVDEAGADRAAAAKVKVAPANTLIS